MGMMGGNPQNVSIPGLYNQQRQMVDSGMFSGAPQSQFPPGYLQQVAAQGLPGFGTGGSNVQGPNQGQGMGLFAGGMNGGASPQGGMGAGGNGGYAGGESGFRSMAPFNNQAGNGWMPNWMQPTPPGSMTGLNFAENGRSIGTGLGLAMGIPGMGELGNFFGNQYINNHVFQNPSDARAPGLGPVTFGDFAQQNSSQGFNDTGGQSRNESGSDFRTLFQWAHGG